jgi:hypothetical protein
MKLNTFECFLRLRFGLLIFLDKGDARAGDFDVQDLGWGHPDEESHLRRQLQGEPGGVAVKPVATDSAGSNEIGQNGSTKIYPIFLDLSTCNALFPDVSA